MMKVKIRRPASTAGEQTIDVASLSWEVDEACFTMLYGIFDGFQPMRIETEMVPRRIVFGRDEVRIEVREHSQIAPLAEALVRANKECLRSYGDVRM